MDHWAVSALVGTTMPEKMGEMRSNGGTTYATVMVWDETLFRYVDLVWAERGDARDAFQELHAPPMTYVLGVRFF